MNDPLRPTNKPEPRRAEPIQPDRPGRGRDAKTQDKPSQERAGGSLQRSRTQEQTALDNVRP